MTLSLSALWVHEFTNGAQGVNASLQGNPAAPFTVTTPEPERDAVRWGTALPFLTGTPRGRTVPCPRITRADGTAFTISPACSPKKRHQTT